jgi:group I intron endonuclease
MNDKPPIIGVYKISNTLSGRYYIGYSTNIDRRFWSHRNKLKKNCHDNIFLQRSYNLDGEDKFKYDIIHMCDREEEAKEIELQYLTNLSIRNVLYNLNYNNSGGDLMTHHPDKEKIIEKIRNSCNDTLSKMTPEERSQKYGKNGMYGKTHTEEVIKKLSELHKGNTHRKGKKCSEETKQKMSANAILRIGEKTPFFGKHHSEETKQKIRENNIGKMPVNNKEITIDGFYYISMTEVSRQLNIPLPTILWRLNSKNPKFDGYNILKKKHLCNHCYLNSFVMLIIMYFKIFNLVIIYILSDLFN